MPASSYGWIITKDHLDVSGTLPGRKPEVGTVGPRNISPSMEARLKEGKGALFQMRDDDGVLYYTGLWTNGGDDRPITDEAFGPLDDFGRPNAGAVHIYYKDAKGAWEEL